jgi:dihydroorotate dehydrogenase electron transfer subunit
VPVDVSAEILRNTRLSADYSVLALAAPGIATAAQPGQFLMVKASTGTDPLLRRPFSVFEVLRTVDGTPIGVSILNKRVGPSTTRLFEARPGQHVQVLGPLGRGFSMVTPPAEAWMVAGGVGLAPFAALAEQFAGRGVRTTLFYGARRGEELFYLDLFRNLGTTLVLATEDGSQGDRGRINIPLERHLAATPPDQAVTIYACGPEGMLAACAALARRYHRPCEVSVERIMGCGTGACYSCVVPLLEHDGVYRHTRSCLAGPVLRGDQIRWD